MSTAATDWKSTACNLCFVNCGLEVQTGGENDREIIKVRGDKNHPASQGYICNKATRINYYQNSRDRLTQPLRRQDDGSYEPIDWDTAITEIAAKMKAVRDEHGGERILYYGGGGQGNHLGGGYAPSVLSALGVKYKGSALSQEKTGLSWVFGRMLGHTIHPEVHEAQVVMLVGKNPFMSNGMDQARNFLRHIGKDESRKLIVMDPRRTETADYADLHLAVKPGRDAWALAAILGRIVQNNMLPIEWLQQHANGYQKIIETFTQIPVAQYAKFAGIDPIQVMEAAKLIASADSFALEEDIGVQMAPHSTLVSYLNLLLMLATGNFGKDGALALPAMLVDLLPPDRFGALDENEKEMSRNRLPATGAPIHSNIFPGNFLAEEILSDSDQRARALIVESANPVHSLAEANKLRRAMRRLECSVVIDVAMTETAREADYVLPAASQYEKWEATFFPRNFPDNYFHLRAPLFEPTEGTLPEAEIHARLVEALGVFEDGELDSLTEAAQQGIEQYQAAFFEALMSNSKVKKSLSYVLYRTLGPSLPPGTETTAAIWGLCQMFVMKNPKYAARAGFEGPMAGTELFYKLLDSPSGAIIAVGSHEEAFERIPFEDKKIRLVIGELLEELESLSELKPLVDTSPDYPFALTAGSRRAYTANCAIRDPRWVKGKTAMALTIHPDDAQRLQIPDGARVRLQTEHGQTEVDLAYDDRMQPGTLSVPNGQGMYFEGEDGNAMDTGVYANELTATEHRDKFIGTPFHKFVPARVEMLTA
ncbi:molybdopterin-dependent oxidoreductase [Pseudomaricurvus alkylphenolicus]|uniref:molybdopterin-dependent oxidoreductase n=1 Tax=Pseudomaricurvus alkylphenolicus TaxID=1306991 RepID=UPI00141DD0BF|nr:molybdopterin-dependent oxidoreductase [Pseudomaricurvus alkylphenolicus]NIB40714.1 molybdopterin-dependent oxidoreductase [Pseudomaricurvus alkylphenolicus]